MVFHLHPEDYPREFGEALAMIAGKNGGKLPENIYADFMHRCKLEKDRYLLTGKCFDQTTIMIMIAFDEPSPKIE